MNFLLRTGQKNPPESKTCSLNCSIIWMRLKQTDVWMESLKTDEHEQTSILKGTREWPKKHRIKTSPLISSAVDFFISEGICPSVSEPLSSSCISFSISHYFLCLSEAAAEAARVGRRLIRRLNRRAGLVANQSANKKRGDGSIGATFESLTPDVRIFMKEKPGAALQNEQLEPPELQRRYILVWRMNLH